MTWEIWIFTYFFGVIGSSVWHDIMLPGVCWFFSKIRWNVNKFWYIIETMSQHIGLLHGSNWLFEQKRKLICVNNLNLNISLGQIYTVDKGCGRNGHMTIYIHLCHQFYSFFWFQLISMMICDKISIFFNFTEKYIWNSLFVQQKLRARLPSHTIFLIVALEIENIRSWTIFPCKIIVLG